MIRLFSGNWKLFRNNRAHKNTPHSVDENRLQAKFLFIKEQERSNYVCVQIKMYCLNRPSIEVANKLNEMAIYTRVFDG